LQSDKDGRFYYGQTQDLDKRLSYHNNGKSRYTEKFRPWKLIAYKMVDSRAEAMSFEKKLKNLHGRFKVLEFIQRHSFFIAMGHKDHGPAV
jgi:putative endonuclease